MKDCIFNCKANIFHDLHWSLQRKIHVCHGNEKKVLQKTSEHVGEELIKLIQTNNCIECKLFCVNKGGVK
jgi:hypothetical protein